MSVVWLLRHGEAQKAPGQSSNDLFSIQDLGLSPRGIEQAESARDALLREPVEAVYASHLRRAQETARVVAAPHGARVEVDPRLAEIRVEGADYATILAGIMALPLRIHEHAPAIAAFRAAMDEIADRHACALVVAHGLSNRAFLANARGLPAHEFLTIEQRHAEATRCRRQAGRWIA